MTSGNTERFIDLRSDTVTRPTALMWEAMQTASLGDDTLEGDPTVRALEHLAAVVTGKEEAMFVVSGTMGNLIASLCHATRGGEAVLDAQAHMAKSEAGGMSRLAHLYPVLIASVRGEMDLDQLAGALRPGFSRYGQPTAMVAVESTHNHSGGYVPSLSYLADIHALASRAGVPVHMDGARVFNAAAALGVDVGQIAAHCDSLTFCLSKGLSAPMGAMLVGSHAIIEQARTFRRMTGGGLRQAGIMAAAGKVAMETMVARLADDNARAQRLWDGLAQIDPQLVDAVPSTSNIVRLRVGEQREANPRAWEAALAEYGILARASGTSMLRLVTHRHIGDEDIDETIAAIASIRNTFASRATPLGVA
ncbi:threonine aldolase [Pandoraea anapnoica]|uniref:Threonine aldolase n=1 Tax=Pandoraea anapnoica TaxID=2508301 RepID=A0A5E5A7G5_9BURK|nr:GntG family PLP-dependent aldolase [Pandoraea anapnoica]VVE69007.1 threonine aldolase [Pandoraea anapnoica]